MEKDITKKGENNMTKQNANIINLFIKNNLDEYESKQILETSKKLLEVLKNSEITYLQAEIALKCTELLMKDEKF